MARFAGLRLLVLVIQAAYENRTAQNRHEKLNQILRFVDLLQWPESWMFQNPAKPILRRLFPFWRGAVTLHNFLMPLCHNDTFQMFSVKLRGFLQSSPRYLQFVEHHSTFHASRMCADLLRSN